MRIRLLPSARKDLSDIWTYVSTESANDATADRLLGQIKESISHLSRNPRMGRSRDYDLQPGLRSLPVRDYIVLYRITRSEILILHVLRGARNLPDVV